MRPKIQPILIDINLGNLFYIFCRDSFICLNAVTQVKGTSLMCCLNLLTQAAWTLIRRPKIQQILFGINSDNVFYVCCRDSVIYLSALTQVVGTLLMCCLNVLTQAAGTLRRPKIHFISFNIYSDNVSYIFFRDSVICLHALTEVAGTLLI